MMHRSNGSSPAASASVDSRLRGNDDSSVIPAQAGMIVRTARPGTPSAVIPAEAGIHTASTEDERTVAGTGGEIPCTTAGAGSLTVAGLRTVSVLRRLPAAGLSSRPPGAVPAVDAPGGDRCRVAGRAFRDLALALALAAVAATAVDAKPWGWTSQGLVDLRARGNEASATRLVPEPERIGLDRRFLSVTAAGGAQAWKGPVTLSGAGRLFARTVPREGERAVRLHVDELHAEYAATPEHFLYAGRRHIVHGRSLGANPLDIAVDPLDLDQSKDTERRRSEVEGQDLLGFESLLGDRFTLTGYWTPGERALLAGSFTLPEWKSDLTALAFDDERPGAGLSLSHTLGEALLAYADVSLRRGRDRTVIRADEGSDAAPGAFLTEDDDGSRLFPQSSVGAGYTLDSGATFNLEYHFDDNGYSTGEWKEIAGLITANDGHRTDARHPRERHRQPPMAERAARSIHAEAALRLLPGAASRPCSGVIWRPR